MALPIGRHLGLGILLSRVSRRICEESQFQNSRKLLLIKEERSTNYLERLWSNVLCTTVLIGRFSLTMIHDIATNQFAHDGASEDIRRKMIKAADAGDSYSCCDAV